MFNDLQKQYLTSTVTLYAGDAPNIDITPGTDLCNFRVFGNSELKRLTASAATITAASQFVIELIASSRSGTPVIATLTSAVPYVNATIVDSGALSVQLNDGETILVRVRGTDADTDDMTGLLIMAQLQPFHDG